MELRGLMVKQVESVSRTPPVAIRRQLRSEVGFGCPLCGSPHLEYHHFDPPFAEAPHHNPDGMIALCATHHAQAPGFTIQQMRELKKKRQHEVSSTFSWRRKHTVFVCGGNYAYNCGAMLRVGGFNLVYFDKDEDGFDTLSLNIYDKLMNPVFVMRRNDWISRVAVDDIIAPPMANKVYMHSRTLGVKLDVEFKDRNKLNGAELAKCEQLGIPKSDNVVFCYFNGDIVAPVPISFKSGGIPYGGVLQFDNTYINCGTGIHIE
jgi:hypothetical protein